MRIRKPDGYLCDCNCGCQLHFYDDDVFVCKNLDSDSDSSAISLEEWKDLPYKEASEYFYFDPLYPPFLLNFVSCPNCGRHIDVWTETFHFPDSIEESSTETIADLIKSKKAFSYIPNREIKRGYKPEEEI